jgi:ribose-phosphate pyrophosphokinase
LYKNTKVFTGNAHRTLAKHIVQELGVQVELGDAYVGKFPDGELEVKINDDVRGSDVFIIQPTCPPVNDNLLELLVLIDCCRRASAGRITAVVPYFGYARQDRKDTGRVPITAKLVANMITTAGADRVLTIDLHAAQIQGFFDIPVDNLYASTSLIPYLRQADLGDIVVVGPDVGSIKLARAYARALGGAELAIVDKRRIDGQQVEVRNVIGNVSGRNALLVDDIISTGGSIAEAAIILKDHGAERIFIGVTHAVLCGNAMDRLAAAPVERVIVTDTIPLDGKDEACGVAIEVVSVAPLLAKAIDNIHRHESVSRLFPDRVML